jgi:hypothetical protein
MNWLTSLSQALTDADPIVVLAIVVLALVFLAYRLALRVLATIDRLAKTRSKP